MVARDAAIAVYMMASGQHGTIYIGVTSDLVRRAFEHREGVVAGFTRKYGCKRLVWYQTCESMTGAIHLEKSLKRWPRAWKCNLIERENLLWQDLYPVLTGQVGQSGADWQPPPPSPPLRHPGPCAQDPEAPPVTSNQGG